MITQVEYNGFTFDNDEATIESLNGLGSPDVRISSAVKSQSDGAIPTGYRYGARTFGWSGRLSAATNALYQAKRQALLLALNMQGLPIEGADMAFTLLSGDVWTLPDVRLSLKPDMSFPNEEPGIIWNSYALVFDSTFAFFEGLEADATQQVTSLDFGVVVPAPVAAPLTSTSTLSASTDPLILTNDGSANALPVITITGPGTNFTITNTTTGHSFTIEETLLVGETIVVDSKGITVTKGGSSVRGSFTGSWIYLQPGLNTLVFSVDSGSDSNTSARTVYKHTYLGV